MNLEELRKDCAIKQKKGLHFILASIIIWSAVCGVHLTTLPIFLKNFLTVCLTAPLLPLAYLFSKWIKVDFTSKENPLINLGILFSLNQMTYLLIAMLINDAVPDKMVMVLAIIFGAHLMPYGWLYQSKIYVVLSVIIPLLVLFIGLNFAPFMVALMMILIEILFSILLDLEINMNYISEL